ncbi:hypothetical protein BU26DRAFT_71738 [Trematosphaeria pertusa]|uniref:Uncharacterized protein n=1 Tax=Trematosphaeria pertusa TaxID=390896 RepID=A0A6A6I6M7_9PLEO|nr:uncharacterized protein BU26DRAFT_71738 [Trematosphaeria pertusa]KAF2245602.1 hypothetical protein BU26DRAFT_71738 [Trematosphaeria pertusa]
MLTLLGDAKTRLATLALCISWTILSRSLLLKLGISSSPGSTFLPPELVECFQSFSLGKGAVTLGMYEPNPTFFALLSRWKQISATLLHSTYVADAFLDFDSRTVNIERALKDLDPLLATYAISHDAGHGKGARLAELRDLLRKGAKFAFTLFSQPSFWSFDWTSDRAAEHGKGDGQLESHGTGSVESTGTGTNIASTLVPAEIVIWPRLLRVMDGDGVKLEGEGEVFGKKLYLSDFGKV